MCRFSYVVLSNMADTLSYANKTQLKRHCPRAHTHPFPSEMQSEGSHHFFKVKEGNKKEGQSSQGQGEEEHQHQAASSWMRLRDP